MAASVQNIGFYTYVPMNVEGRAVECGVSGLLLIIEGVMLIVKYV